MHKLVTVRFHISDTVEDPIEDVYQALEYVTENESIHRFDYETIVKDDDDEDCAADCVRCNPDDEEV